MRKILLATCMFALLPMQAVAGDRVETHISASATVEHGDTYRASDRTFEVFHYGDSRDSRRDVMDRALYKAAKKTLSEGYDWFRVIDRETERETTRTRGSRSRASAGYHRVPERSCGLLTCTTRTRTYYSGGIDSGFPDRSDTVYTVILEVELGEGIPEYSEDVYDARIVRNSYR